MKKQEAIDLVEQAIEAGIFNDLGSGSNVDVTVITKGNVEYLRGYGKPNERGAKEQSYKYPRGTTRVLRASVRGTLDVPVALDQMDIS